MSLPDRIERARAALAPLGWDGLVATPGVNFTHLTGLPLERSERLACLGVPREGEPWVVCPAFEAERVAAALPDARLVAWEETEDPFARAAERIRASGGGTWGVEPTTAYHDAARLAAALGEGARWVDGAPLFEPLRRAKDDADVAALRRAIAEAWDVHDEILRTLAAGDTERGVAARIGQAFATRGRQGWSLVQFGPSSAVPHGEPGPRALDGAQAVLLDWGGWGDGFTADLTRTYWWDGGIVPETRAPEEFRSALETVRAAQSAALGIIRPGVSCGAVDEAARRIVREAGWGERFLHRLGHGLGREIHEPPYLVAGSGERLAAGDVVTVEPGVYFPGRFGVRWEDDVRVVAGGAEVLSRRPVAAG